MIDKLLLIEGAQVATLREILSNLHLEEQAIVQSKKAHLLELARDRIILRKKARLLRIEKESLLKNSLEVFDPLDVENQYNAILITFPATDVDQISELRYLELQKQQLIEKTIVQIKLNRNIRGMIKHDLIPLPCIETKDVVNKKKTLTL